MTQRLLPSVGRALCWLVLLTGTAAAAAGEPRQLSPAQWIDRELQPMGKLLQNMRRKIDSGVAGVSSGPRSEISGWVSGCCGANIVRLRKRTARLEATGRRLVRLYEGRFDENGARLARELVEQVGRFDELLEALASAPGREQATRNLQGLEETALAISSRKTSLAACCSGFTLPPPPDEDG